jgi:O-antigen/teichoic acid export membrane protein
MVSERAGKFQIINRRLIQFTTLMVLFCLIGQLFGKEIITYVLPQSYNNTIIYLPYILFGIVFTGINHFFINVFIYYKNTIYLPFFTLFSAGLSLGLNIIFIPKYGSLVAAITTIISFAFSSLMSAYIINYKYKNIKFSYLKIIIILIFAMNPFLIILVNMDISILTAIFKAIYLITFIFVFYNSIPKDLNIFKIYEIIKKI